MSRVNQAAPAPWGPACVRAFLGVRRTGRRVGGPWWEGKGEGPGQARDTWLGMGRGAPGAAGAWEGGSGGV